MEKAKATIAVPSLKQNGGAYRHIKNAESKPGLR
jgi:hypothetical protein